MKGEFSYRERVCYEPFLCREVRDQAAYERIGFFHDGLSPGDLERVLRDMRWVTPTEHLAPEGVVLCTTGAFDPLHAGHIDMLMAAKDQLESKGIKIAGALIQPDHDNYVRTKHSDAKCAADRIQFARDYIKDIPWIAVDPWPSIYQDRPLNYTTILRRTERYLKRQVVYVFGSDNAGFSDAFLPHEFVCIARTDVSSTRVRPTTVWPIWEEPHYANGNYLIRDDLKWATQSWNPPALALSSFVADLMRAFMTVWPDHVPSLIDVERQQELVDSMSGIVNFDVVTGGSHHVTRLFHPCATQVKPVAWHTSPLELIPAGPRALVDDDIASGTTAAYIKSLTPQVEWQQEISLASIVHPGPIFDICVARDFLFGARAAGLGIRYRGFSTRAPYITPWVDLTSRAKIPPAKQARFTQAVIEANIRFFEACPGIVAETGNDEFWRLLGYRMDTPMLDIARDLAKWNPNIS